MRKFLIRTNLYGFRPLIGDSFCKWDETQSEKQARLSRKQANQALAAANDIPDENTMTNTLDENPSTEPVYNTSDNAAFDMNSPE